ncbi:DUF3833 family protein [Sulfitobacter sp. HNIBRBA3233]|uniref:DUF3833 family protein n=1 Tax=Sulfitobacter marinivivus TaxID=3158558 RepID=UPI0032DE95E3
MSDEIFFFLLGGVLIVLATIARVRLASFISQSGDDYSGEYPLFKIKEHLNGKMTCDGVIFGPLGRVTSTFTADFDVSWDDNKGTIRERFTYQDSSTQEREWTLDVRADGTFDALADDVPGVGRGEISGPAVLFRYPITLPENSGGHTLRAFDCMYLTPTGTIVNRSQFRKFGFKVAELVATIRKKEKT